MNLLPGWQQTNNIVNRGGGSATRTFISALNNVTAAAQRTFSLNLPAIGLKRLVIGHLGASGTLGPLNMTLGAGAGTPLVKQGESLVKGAREMSIWECWTTLDGAHNVVVNYGASQGTTSTVLMAYALQNLLSEIPHGRAEATGNEVTTLQVVLNVPANGIVLGFFGCGDGAPSTNTWNTPTEDADAVSSVIGWSCVSMQNQIAEIVTLRQVNAATLTDPMLIGLTYR